MDLENNDRKLLYLKIRRMAILYEGTLQNMVFFQHKDVSTTQSLYFFYKT